MCLHIGAEGGPMDVGWKESGWQLNHLWNHCLILTDFHSVSEASTVYSYNEDGIWDTYTSICRVHSVLL